MANIRIPLKSIKKTDLLRTSGMTADEVWQKYKPDYLMNMALYDTDTKKPLTYMLDEGEKDGYLFSTEGFGIKGDNEICWTTMDGPGLRDFIGGAPTLLKDGQLYVEWGNKYSAYLDGSHRRGVIGFNTEYLFMLCTDYPLSIPATADTAKGLGMTHAVSVDGGGSLHLQSKKRTFVESTRENASWLLVYMKTAQEEQDELDNLTIKEDLIPIPSGRRRPGTLIRPTTVTIHSTDNPKSTAKNERDNLARNDNDSKASFHVVVDQKEAILCIPLDERANHAGTKGSGNSTSIGIEICESGDREKTLRNAIIITAQILEKLNLTADDLRQHYDWNGKNCPRILRNTGRWEWFKSEVIKEMKKKTITETTVTHKGEEFKAIIVDGVTYAPVRALAESLGKTVNYNASTKKVTIV